MGLLYLLLLVVLVKKRRHGLVININGPAATQMTGWHSILFILYTTARLHCVCLLHFTMLYFIACCSFSVIFSLRATMLINLNLNLTYWSIHMCRSSSDRQAKYVLPSRVDTWKQCCWPSTLPWSGWTSTLLSAQPARSTDRCTKPAASATASLDDDSGFVDVSRDSWECEAIIRCFDDVLITNRADTVLHLCSYF